MSFMTLKNVCAKALAKNFQKKIHGFCMFFKFKGSILRFFFPLDFPLFFYSFLSAVITKEIFFLNTKTVFQNTVCTSP